MERPWWVTDESEWMADCTTIVQCVRDLIEGRKGVIESARTLQCLARRVRNERDPDFIVFIGIDSECHELPFGEVRTYWSASALAKADSRISSLEELWREQAMRAATRLLEKYL